jgi:hypothetical protein
MYAKIVRVPGNRTSPGVVAVDHQSEFERFWICTRRVLFLPSTVKAYRPPRLSCVAAGA